MTIKAQRVPGRSDAGGLARRVDHRDAAASNDPPGALPPDGRIPFRLRVGVTGHRQITADLSRAVWQTLQRIEKMLSGRRDPGSLVTDVRFAVVSQLADGADRLVVEHVFDYAARRGQDARLEVILPMQRARYEEAQGFSENSRQEFARLLAQATVRFEPPDRDNAGANGSPPRLGVTDAGRADEYVAAGKKLIERCDVLIALWDGQPSTGKRGGSAHTLLAAAALGKPCVWIPADGESEAQDNLEPGSSREFVEEVRRRSALDIDDRADSHNLDVWSLEQVSRAFLALDEFNREPHHRTGDVAASHFGALANRALHPQFDRKLAREIGDWQAGGVSPLLAAPFARANTLADLYQALFKRISYLVLLFAALAAVMLAISVDLGTESSVWPALEFGCLSVALAGFVLARAVRLHGRWLCYRVLAERLRTARYTAPIGIDLCDQAHLQGMWAVTQTEDWLMRAFEEVWDCMPRARTISASDIAELKQLLAENWIQGQIDYHDMAKATHGLLLHRLTLILYLAFALTLAAAALDAILAGLDAAPAVVGLSKALTITLPVVGASVGGALTISQHHALAERSEQMQSDLRRVKQDVREASDLRSLREATIAATSLIAPETGSWFGALWFLDIEHP